MKDKLQKGKPYIALSREVSGGCYANTVWTEFAGKTVTFRSGPEGDSHAWDGMIKKGCSEGWDCFKTMNQQRSFLFFQRFQTNTVVFTFLLFLGHFSSIKVGP